MKAVISALNLILDGKPLPVPLVIFPEEAREALSKIEHCELAMAALRAVLDYPTNAEAKTHAEKVLASIAWRPKKAAPQAPAPAGETTTLSSSKTVAPVGAAAAFEEDVSDLV